MTLSIALSALAIVMTVAAGVIQPAHAVFSGDMSPKARSGDADYADGMDAWDAKNWDGVVAAMRKVVARRPWPDKAWTRLGFALRKRNRLTSRSKPMERRLPSILTSVRPSNISAKPTGKAVSLCRGSHASILRVKGIFA